MSDKKSVLDRLIRWIRKNFYCRFDRHDFHKIYADDEYPNPVICFVCGQELEIEEGHDRNWFGEYP